MRRKNILVLVLLSHAPLWSCSSNGSTADQTSLAPTGSGSTIDDLILSTTGFSLSDLSVARLRAQGQLGIDCMVAKGFDPNVSEFPGSGTTSRRSPTVYGGSAQIAIDTVMAYTPGIQDAVTSSYSAAYNVCLAQGIDAVKDPIDDFTQWLMVATSELTDRIFADGRVVEADVAQTVCLRGIGYPYSTTTEFVNSIVDRANPIVEEYIGGSLPKADALQKLADLKAEETQVAPAVNGCADAYNVVLSEVRSEYYSAFAADHRVEIVEKLSKVDLSQVSVYLPAD